MSRVNEIKNKNVDFYVYPNAANVLSSVIEDEDNGKLNIVVDEVNNDNALYVGDTHIASGWGFNNIGTVRELEEFLSSENIKKLVSNDFTINQNITYNITQEASQSSGSIQNTYTYFHNDEIAIKDNKLNAKTSFRITDATISFTNGLSAKMGDTIEQTLDENDLTIRTLQLKYDIIDYNIAETTTEINYSIYENDTKIGTTSSFNATLSGKTETMALNLSDVAKKINKIYNEKENVIDYCIEINNERIKLFTVIYRYKIYISSIEPTDVPNISAIYYKDKDNELNINYTSDPGSFTYVILPGQLFPQTDVTIILKKSNIGTPFEYISSITISGRQYNIYKSRQRYNHGRTWIIK